MAHEIKNPMAGIKVSMEVLSQDSPLPQEDKEVLLMVINEIDRITAMIKGLLSYARPPKPKLISLDINHFLEGTIKSARYSLRSPKYKAKSPDIQIEFVKDLGADLPNIFVDPGQLQQIFLNLILNSVDAIYSSSECQGVITIQTRQSSDKTVKISIADNGKGIDSESLEYVFKPFFTTKSKGTGLGLAISKRLVEQHNGGNITVENNPGGKGTIFTLTFPVGES